MVKVEKNSGSSKSEIVKIGVYEELLAKGGRHAELFQLRAMGYQ